MYQVGEKERHYQVYEAGDDDVDPHEAFLSSNPLILIIYEPEYSFLSNTYVLIL
jgi:hypothetical protein